MSKQWTMVRITPETRKKLEGVKECMEAGKKRLRRPGQRLWSFEMSLDQVIHELCERYQGDQDRKRRSRQVRQIANHIKGFTGEGRETVADSADDGEGALDP